MLIYSLSNCYAIHSTTKEGIVIADGKRKLLLLCYQGILFVCISHCCFRSLSCGVPEAPHILGCVIQQAHFHIGHCQLNQPHCKPHPLCDHMPHRMSKQEANYSHNEIEILGDLSHHNSLTILKLACILKTSMVEKMCFLVGVKPQM